MKNEITITIQGAVGVGKSAIAQLIQEALSSKGFKSTNAVAPRIQIHHKTCVRAVKDKGVKINIQEVTVTDPS